MKPQIYLIKESPDFNFLLENGRMDRIAANRAVLCIMTEFGLCNDRKMNAREFSNFIESIQITSGQEQSHATIDTIEFTYNPINTTAESTAG